MDKREVGLALGFSDFREVIITIITELVGAAEGFEADEVVQFLDEVEVSCWGCVLGGVLVRGCTSL